MMKILSAAIVVFTTVVIANAQTSSIDSQQRMLAQQTSAAQQSRQALQNLLMVGPGNLFRRPVINEPILPNTYGHFYIQLVNGEWIYVRSNIESLASGENFILAGKGRKLRVIKPQDTKEIYYTIGGERIVGIPVQGAWIFKTYSGRINAYSQFPDRRQHFILFLQKGEDNAVESFDPKKLQTMVEGHTEATLLAKQGRVEEAIDVFNGVY